MIVLFAREDDRHALAVRALLERDHGEAVSIFNLSDFPSAVRLTGTFSSKGASCVFVNRDGRWIDFNAVKSFWWRRPQPLWPDARIANVQVQQFALQECLSALYGLLRCCPGLWVNDIENDQNADFKPRQLAVARGRGLPPPETLITNDPAEATAFFEHCDGEVVFKAFNQRGLIWTPTRRLGAADLAGLDALQCAPVIFQRYVAGAKDIRATVIGDMVIATEFEIGQDGPVDHRLALDTARCSAHPLPVAIEHEVIRIVRDLQLEYGSVDLRLTHDGGYVFFEVNTAGEFLYLEERSGQPITAAMAAHLASGRPARGQALAA